MSPSSKKIGIVIQRAHPKIVGGAEEYAFKLAHILAKRYPVELLTTCSLNTDTWRNEELPGLKQVDENIWIRRFPVSIERSPYWHELHRILDGGISSESYARMSIEQKLKVRKRVRNLPLGFAHEWLKHQGPWAPQFYDFLRHNHQNYSSFFFKSYLYPFQFYSIPLIQNVPVYFVPAFHDEIPAFLPLFQTYKSLNHLFMSEAEKNLAENEIYGEKLVQAQVMGFGIEEVFERNYNDVSSILIPETPYILYAGRLEADKGIAELVKFFCEFQSIYKKKIKLVIIGKGSYKPANDPNIEFRGFVEAQEKDKLLANALALVQPSLFESLSIILLEAFRVKTPAIVNSGCQVLADHIKDSVGGFAYKNKDEFQEALLKLIENSAQRKKLGESAYEYYLNRYSLSAFENRIFKLVEE